MSNRSDRNLPKIQVDGPGAADPGGMVAGLVVKVHPAQLDQVGVRLADLSGVEIAARSEAGFAVVIEASRPSAQERLHQAILELEGVDQVLVAYQGSEDGNWNRERPKDVNGGEKADE